MSNGIEIKPVKSILYLLESSRDKKFGNYEIKYFSPNKAKIYHYRYAIAELNFGDPNGGNKIFRITQNGRYDAFGFAKTHRAKMFLRKYLTEQGFKEVV